MDSFRSATTGWRVRDALMALMFVVAVALASRHHQELDAQVVWREKIVQGKMNKAVARNYGTLSPPPPPLTLDLDGDGVDEIVTVQQSEREGSFLSVLSVARDGKRKREVVQRPVTLRRVALVLEGEGDVSRSETKSSGTKKKKPTAVPIALGGGFLDGGVARVVVLTDDWSVLCFDKELELLWRRRYFTSAPIAHSRMRSTNSVVNFATESSTRHQEASLPPEA